MIKPLNDNVLLKTTEEENIAIVLAVGDRKLLMVKMFYQWLKKTIKLYLTGMQ